MVKKSETIQQLQRDIDLLQKEIDLIKSDTSNQAQARVTTLRECLRKKNEQVIRLKIPINPPTERIFINTK